MSHRLLPLTFSLKEQQKGTTLIISLMLLFIITLLGLNSIRVSQQQEKMAHHTQDKIISFQAAEAAVLNAESLIGALDTEPNVTSGASCPNAAADGTSFCIVNYNNNLLPEIESNSWWSNNGEIHAINYPSKVKAKNHVSTSPLFYIEYVRFVSDSPVIGKGIPAGMHYYRIFGRGTGVTDKANTFIETSYRRRY